MNEEAQAVEDALAGGVMCPWCQQAVKPEAVEGGSWRIAYHCARFFYRTNVGLKPAYRVGRYWTAVWEWAYEVSRPRDAKPIVSPAAGSLNKTTPDDFRTWMAGVNTKKPKRSNRRKLAHCAK